MLKQKLAALAISGLCVAAAGCTAPSAGDARYVNEIDAVKIPPSSADRAGSAPSPVVAPSNPTAPPSDGAGSFPRSFLIPGTDTSIRIGG
jgi:hypothetical protein